MTIDIINYTDAQLATLTAEQLLEVKSVQQQKNRLTIKLEEKKREENRMMKMKLYKQKKRVH